MSRKPVIFIPGFPATELLRRSDGKRLFPPALEDLRDRATKAELLDLLSDPDSPDVVAGKPILNILGIAKQAESLYDLLSRMGYDTADTSTEFVAIGWDWRKGIDDAEVTKRVKEAVDFLFKKTGQKVVALVHSTGGLVFRSVWERRAQVAPNLAARVEQVLAFGVPWAGTLKALNAISEGSPVGLPFIGGLLGQVTAAESKRITTRAQAAYDLCPPDPLQTQGMEDIRLFTTAGNQVGPMVDTSWIGADAKFDKMREAAAKANTRFGNRTREIAEFPPTTNVAGWGLPTLQLCDLKKGKLTYFETTPADSNVGKFEDELGDSTVALVSAAWLQGANVRTFFLPIGVEPENQIPTPHPRIWDALAVKQLFQEVLNDERRTPFVTATADNDDAIDRGKPKVRIRISAADIDGKPLPKAVATVNLNGTKTAIPMSTTTHVNVDIPRKNLPANVGFDRFRFEIDVKWTFRDGEKARKLPVLINV
jgi:hypothetical protein